MPFDINDINALTALQIPPEAPPPQQGVPAPTPDDIAAIQATMQAAQQANPPQPQQIPPQTGGGSGSSSSVSIEQQTPEGKRVAAKLGNMGPRTDAENARYNAENQNWMGTINDAYNGLSTETAKSNEAQAKAQEAAAGDVAGAGNAAVGASAAMGADQAQQQVIQSGGQAAQAIAQQMVFNTEDTAAKQSQALQMASRAKYEGSLAKLEAMQIDPNRLFRSGAVQWSSAIAAVAAASNKPGNLALSNSLMTSITNAVANDVNGQIENMKNQKSVTEGFKTLWDMTAADSQSEAEARAKVTGAYLGVIGSYIGAQALQEQSQVTRASLGEAQAKIQVEKVKAASDAYTELAKIHSQRLDTISQDARTAAQVAVQRASVNESARQYNETAKAKAKAEQQQMANEGVYANTPGGGNRYQGQAKGGTPEERGKNLQKINDLQATAATASDTVQRAMDLAKLISEKSDEELTAMGFKGKLGAKDELSRQLDALATIGGTQIGRALGLAPFSDTDREMMSGIVADPAKLSNILGDKNSSAKSSEEVLSFLQRNLDNQITANVRPGTDEEIAANKTVYGEEPFHDYQEKKFAVPSYGGTITGSTYEDKGVPGTQRDYTQYKGNTMPDVKAQTEGALNPSPPTRVDNLVKDIADLQSQPTDSQSSEKSGRPVWWDQYTSYMKRNDLSPSAHMYSDGNTYYQDYFDDIYQLARVATKSDNPDEQAAAIDSLHQIAAQRKNPGKGAEPTSAEDRAGWFAAAILDGYDNGALK
jgi:hypothetical protein